ncbi:MAG: Ig-like domain-containing protein, partial [Firmicutes bacterium]|nr:Ig-like domain-containing protein [Bacillota bacterium]
YVQFEGSGNWLTRINTAADTATYNAINSETEYKNRPKLYDADILLKNNCVIKINTLESSLNGVTDRYSVLYKELYARRKALGEKGAYNYYSADWSNWNKVESLFEKINRVILEQASVRVNLENGFERYEKKHKYNMESYENYKAQLQEKLDDYLTAQTNFGLACAMYSDVAKKQREHAQSGLPDYVYTQKFQSYTATVLLADGSNTALETKINAASDKNKFFKDEARKLEECMDMAALYEKQKEVAYNYAKYYLRELADIDHDGYELWSGSMGYLNADMFGNYGIDPKEFVQYREMENELKALYKANYTSADILGPIESCKALYRDFTGTGTYHNMFLQRYNEMVIKAPYYKRKIQSGELSINSFNYYYADVLMEPYNALESKSRAVSYTGTYTDIETGNEKAFRYMLYGSNGILDDIRSLEFNKNAYIPVVSVTKQGASSGGAADITLAQGGSGVLKVSVQPQNADERGVIWYSEDDSKAVVDQSGKVTGIGEGSTTICAAAKDAPFVEVKDDNGNITGYTCPDEYIAKFTVNVTDEIIEEVYKFGDADADNAITASDASFILQKTLLSTFKLPIQKKTDDWMDYVDVDADTKVTANDAAFVLQKTLVSTFELPVEKK